ncbi:cell adhesion molecule 1-like [Eriocheir sinensis]|uniref:cell adhesion molecule 1-like n=1 Tax=Eriocheir sinensis TaxID=95602 RepID=UPI0021C972C4|nr:cell adhesion molecule 1-like [Eriocheir sinensis]
MTLPATLRPLLSLAILLILFFGRAVPLEILEVRVPEYKVRGAKAELQCRYALENATLYSLKWYKGDKQFFQYIPGNKKTKNTFFVKGVHVDVERSTGASVVLSEVELGTSGTYRCEVITEAPVFHTKFGEGNMTVIDLPESAPVLDGAKTSYQLGEQVTVNCTSLFSKPAATLEWFINDEQVVQQHFLKRYAPQREPDGLETAVLGLSFVTSRSHFPHGEMRLKCVAKIATVYFQSQETSVIETGFLPQTQAKERRYYPYSSGTRAGGEGTSLLLFLLLFSFSLLQQRAEGGVAVLTPPLH